MNELETAFPDANIIYGKPYQELLAQAEYAIVGREIINAKVLSPNLRVISKYGVGLDNIDFHACKSNKTDVYFSPGVNREEVVELTLANMIILTRNMIHSNQMLKKGIWLKNGGKSLSELTVALIGLGNIGTLMAETLVSTFRPRLLLCDILDKSQLSHQLNAPQLSFEECLRQADLISFHVPFDHSTKSLFNCKSLEILKPGAIIINTSRGEVVDEEALTTGVERGIIKSAAIDVFCEEPLNSNSKLNGIPEIFLTPHIAGNSLSAVLKMGRAAIDRLKETI